LISKGTARRVEKKGGLEERKKKKQKKTSGTKENCASVDRWGRRSRTLKQAL